MKDIADIREFIKNKRIKAPCQKIYLIESPIMSPVYQFIPIKNLSDERMAKKLLALAYYHLRDKSVVLADDRMTPVFYVRRKTPDLFLVFKFNKAEFRNLNLLKNTKVNKMVGILDSKPIELFETKFENFIAWKQKLNTMETLAVLAKEIHLRVSLFEKLFGKIDDSNDSKDLSQIKYNNWRIFFDSGIKSEKDVITLLNEVERRCSKFKKLCYGTVEVKKNLKNSITLADYCIEDDAIRIRAKKTNTEFVASFLHELGHRLYFKFLNNAEKNEVENKFYELKRKQRQKFDDGDVVELQTGYIFTVIKDSVYQTPAKLIQVPARKRKFSPGDVVVFKDITPESVVAINNKSFAYQKIRFPSDYAASNHCEFFSECFSCWIMGDLNTELSLWMNKNFL